MHEILLQIADSNVVEKLFKFVAALDEEAKLIIETVLKGLEKYINDSILNDLFSR